MSWLIGLLKGKAVELSVGGAVLIGLALAKKKVPELVSAFVGKELGRALDPNTSDPKEKELIHNVALAVIRLVEYKLPDAGLGPERYRLAAGKITTLLPMFKGQEDKLKAIIESAVQAMDAELKKASQQ